SASGIEYVTFTNRSTGLLVDGMYRTDNGDNVGQWSNSGSSAQQWSIESNGNYVMLKNRATGLYIDGMGRNSNPSIAGLWAYSGSDAQQWTQEGSGSGYFRFKNKATGLYLDGLGALNNGDDLGQWSDSPSYNQQWSINTVGTQSAKMSSLSKENISEDSKFSIDFYPNPFVNEFKVEATKSNEPFRVTIFDTLGRKVEAAESSTSSQLAMGSSLKSGLYIVQVEGVNSNYSRSFKILKK
ncbi:RICIN domain-containing protein, partial [Mariniflexile sp. HMF6888]|uniref:RICIN domain-containing protein n=1 Tax=Mariniflexile sp. HMF6888 TaxID=3373086 RepID=UPI0037AB5B24